MSEKINIYFLGTGGTAPFNKSRRFPCIVLKYKSYLINFDFGECCQFSIFSESKIKPMSSDIFILITHMHEDHISGLSTFLHTLYLADYRKRVVIIGPSELHDLIRHRLTQRFFYNVDFEITFLSYDPIKTIKRIYSNNEMEISCVRTKHFVKSCGYLVTIYKRKLHIELVSEIKQKLRGYLQNGFKVYQDGKIIEPDRVSFLKTFTIYYSGDTQVMDLPFEKVNVMIHEATYLNEIFAFERGHSNISDLVRKMGEIADKLFLVHISSRYRNEDLEKLRTEIRNLSENIIIPNDGDIASLDF